MPINESYHILSIQSLRKFTLPNFRLLKLKLLDLELVKVERKLKQSLELELSILTRELYVSVFRHVHVGKSFAKCVLFELAV